MNNPGWTLLELMVVSMILCIGGAVAAGRWVEARAMHQLQSTSRILVADLSNLRIRAVSLNRPLSLIVGEDRVSYGLAERGATPTRRIELPRGIRFSIVPATSLTFYPRANVAPAGSFVLSSDRAGSIRVVVAPFGRVRWEWIR